MWTLRTDDAPYGWIGVSIGYKAALDYCRNLSLGGFHDWRLPEIGELAGIYDPSVTSRFSVKSYNLDVHVKGGIKVSTAWSATPANPVASSKRAAPQPRVLAFGFDEGNVMALFESQGSGVLCVRRAGE